MAKGFLDANATQAANGFTGKLTNQQGQHDVDFTDKAITKPDGSVATEDELGIYSCLDYDLDTSNPGAPTAKNIVLRASSIITGPLSGIGDEIRTITLKMRDEVQLTTLIMRKK